MDLKIDSHYITLGDFLKFFGLAATGGEAKTIVKSGVNNLKYRGVQAYVYREA